MKQKWILILLVLITAGALASDLPIDIEAIRRQGEEQQEALTVQWQIDLFSETSDALSREITERREREAAEILHSLFTEPYALYIADHNEALKKSAIEARLFSEPIQTRTLTQSAEEISTPLWVILTVLVGAAALGIAIATVAKAKRKELAANVHYDYSQDA